MSNAIRDEVLASLGISIGSELKHFGRKGMKWGVTRERGPNGRVSGPVSDDHTNTKELKGKRQAEMSNAELKKVNERLQLERKNKELQSRGALEKIKLGTAAVGTVLAIGATVNAVMGFAKSPAGQAIAKALAKDASNPEWLF